MPTPIYRKNYSPSNYLIKTTNLVFELFEDKAIISNTMVFYKNPLCKNLPNKANDLFLNGEQLELLSITKNNSQVDYTLSDKGLSLTGLEDEFSLSIKTQIYPHKNTALNGLYQSSGNFCTQCEAEGFRTISYYLDRPDVLSVWTTSIIANQENYPVLLSNGDLIEQGNQGQGSHNAVWHDPHPKPCYLFALVAGDFAVLEDSFTTKQGRKVALKIYTQAHNSHKTAFAMSALKKSFKWDEARFNLAYDLDTFMIVAVDDFNMGAMENKSLNIFNSKYVLADTHSTTDEDFMAIESVIGHEYFHNWTGNRITCRDWFQLSLKEGLTVFRDQEFSADMSDRSIQRIDDVVRLKTQQFAEDAGTMSHPVRPESYVEMNNFYTATIYEKGAEVVRMIHTILGEVKFQAGIALYIKRHDGQAVTIDDFIRAMADANSYDFKQFMRWYSQKGTPIIKVNSQIKDDKFLINFEQILPENQADFYLPCDYCVFDELGNKLHQDTLIIKQKHTNISLDIQTKNPILSVFRNFSSPVIVKQNNKLEDKIHLLKHENDGFSAWQAAQDLWQYLILDNSTPLKITPIFKAFNDALLNNTNQALVARLLTPPSEQFLTGQVNEIDTLAIYEQKQTITKQFANYSQANLQATYLKLSDQKTTTQFNNQSIANRALKNMCLGYLIHIPDQQSLDLTYAQYQNATCMSDKFGALSALTRVNNSQQDIALADFYQTYQNDEQVLDKWFGLQAKMQTCDIERVNTLMKHNKFSFTNPNRLRALLGVWMLNHQFHNPAGYQLITKIIIGLNNTNPQIGARLVGVFNHYKKHTQVNRKAQKQCLEQILAIDNLSNDILEIVQTALQG